MTTAEIIVFECLKFCPIMEMSTHEYCCWRSAKGSLLLFLIVFTPSFMSDTFALGRADKELQERGAFVARLGGTLSVVVVIYWSIFGLHHQKLNSFTPFRSLTAYFTNSIPKILIHPKNLHSSCFPASYNLSPSKSKINKLDLISLSS